MISITPLRKYYRYLHDKKIIPEASSPKHFSKHMAYYVFTADKVRNKVGIEIGSFSGFGTYYLSRFARRIIGVDIDISALFLGRTFFSADNFDLMGMDGTALGFKDNSLDFVVSSHMIEHIPLHLMEKFVYECARVLKPDGVFYVGTPNLEHSLKKPHHMEVMCKQHSKEFMHTDLKALLNKAFKQVAVYGVRVSRKQRIYRRLKKIGIIKWFPDSFNPIRNFYNYCDEDDFIVTSKDIALSQDLLAVCQK